MYAFRTIGLPAVTISLALAANIAAAQEVITLKVADSYNPNHYISVQGTQPWIKRIEELSGGKVKIEYYPAEQLGKLADLPSLLTAGVMDVALVPAGVFAADYPLTGVATLPGFGTSSAEVSRAYNAVLAADGPLRNEFTAKGFRPLAYICTPQHDILVNVPNLSSLDGLKGLKIRATAGVPSEIIAALGATPVQVSPPEMYTALERGTIDGAFIPIPNSRSYKLEEVVKSTTSGANLGSIVTGYAITEARWQQLPDEVKAAFEQANKEFVERLTAYQDAAVATDQEYIAGKGVSLFKIEGADADQLKTLMAPIVDGWVGTMQQKGLDGQAVIDAWKKELVSN